MNMSDYDFIVATLRAFEAILAHGEKLKDDNNLDENPFVVKIQNYHCQPLLEELQNHPMEDVCKSTKDILEVYFV